MKCVLFFLAVLLVFGNSVSAEVLRLKNGQSIEGEIVGEDEKSFLVETQTEWKRIMKADVKPVQNGTTILEERVTTEEQPPNRERTSVQSSRQDTLELDFGPTLGVFYHLDQAISSYHKLGLHWGINATAWKGRKGFSIEYGQYTSIYRYYSYTETLRILPLWFSALYRPSEDSGFFLGLGMGLVNIKLDSGGFGSINSAYPGYQALAGIRGKNVGGVLKYSILDTCVEWSSGINFSTVSVLAQIYL